MHEHEIGSGIPASAVEIDKQPTAELPGQHASEEPSHVQSSVALNQIAVQLAGEHKNVRHMHTRAVLLKQLQLAQEDIHAAFRYFQGAVEEQEILSYAAEWLLDNYFVVRQASRAIEHDLPQAYYDRLPKLVAPKESLGAPRIYVLARAFMQAEDCTLTIKRLARFIAAYQQETPLSMGELWALPIMLRLILIFTLADSAARVAHIAQDHDVPRARLLQLEYELDDDERVAKAITGLRTIDNLDWNELFERVSVVDSVLRRDPGQVYAGMTFATRDQYRKVIEQLASHSDYSEVEVAACAVELAETHLNRSHSTANGAEESHLLGYRKTDSSSTSQGHQKLFDTQPASHVGYYLLGDGQHQLKEHINYRPDANTSVVDWLLAHPTTAYLSPIIGITALLEGFILGYALAAGGLGWTIALALLLGLVPSITAAVSVTNWLLTQILPTRQLPRMDFDEEIPTTAQTIVVVPALLSSRADVDSLFDQIELHYLRNVDQEQRIRFALLTDFADADVEHREEDDMLLAAAAERIENLNRKYPGAPFFFLHRRRMWNPAQQAWMGWERKRGKLHEFNVLLRSEYDAAQREFRSNTTSYTTTLGDLSFLASVRYVITLDADTILPTGAGRKLIGALAHPLNQAQFDEKTGRIESGYSILQPRTEIVSSSAQRSLFTKIFAGEPGVDLYTFAVSDVYQDLFGEGIYVGKGIYDVDAFERSLHRRIPDNTLLSHDLFEGVMGRAGLVTDIVLYEDYPPNYLVKVHRGHRWVRGDWQLLPWLYGRAPSVDGAVANDLPAIGRWKILDNLRRSLVAPALLLFLFCGWIFLPGSPLVWTLFGLATLGVSVVTAVLNAILRYASGSQTKVESTGIGRISHWPIVRSAILFALELAFLPYEALRNLHAILLTLIRLAVTRRKLLEWVTAARSAQILGANVSAETTFRHMLPAILVVMAGATVTISLRPSAVLAALPVWLLWVFAAEIAHTLGRSAVITPAVLGQDEQRELRILARKTWLFFERFVGPEDNWLPPDHYQEFPRGVVAHRTSPTNIGLYLISVLAAHRFGYENLQNATLRLQAALDAMEGLDKYRGHLYNWFRTTDLELLQPAYVSYVDSGNLAACLLVLKQGCLQLGNVPIQDLIEWQGLLDTLDLLQITVQRKLGAATEDRQAQHRETVGRILRQVGQEIQSLRQLIKSAAEEPQQWLHCLESAAPTQIGAIETVLLQVITNEEISLGSDAVEELSHLLVSVRRQVAHMLADLDALMPGLAAVHQPPAILDDETLPPQIISAWRQLADSIQEPVRLREVQEQNDRTLSRVTAFRTSVAQLTWQDHPSARSTIEAALQWCDALLKKVQQAQKSTSRLWSDLKVIALRSERLLAGMDFTFLFDKQRKLFHIGYNVETGRLDANYYDLLVSEARIGSLFAIADNQAPMTHWLYLSRPVTQHANQPLLLSWSGTMFEYLMPMLLMRSYPGTMLHESCRRAVERQIEYARGKGMPWGISESGFYHFDAAMNYQYRAFGTPGLGLKRGLEEDLVVAPYASFLALPLVPQAVLKNINTLRTYDMEGRYGMYEALDFSEATETSLSDNHSGRSLAIQHEPSVVQSYMAHHQGMILGALANACLDDYFVALFHSEPKIQSVELLLQEQIPTELSAEAVVDQDSLAESEKINLSTEPGQSWPVPVDTPMPLVHAISNGTLTSVVTNASAGFTTWKDTRVTRWRPDATLDNWGHWIFITDEDSGYTWSAGRQPLGIAPTNEETTFSAHAAEFRRRDDEIRTDLQIFIDPDEDVEIRRVTLSNDSNSRRRLRVTSYAEVVLTDAGADKRHPAFAKLFVESEYVSEKRLLLYRRRPRSANEVPTYLAHHVVIPGDTHVTGTSYESDRSKFIGRYRTARNPVVLESGTSLSETTGATLDPILSLQTDIVVEPNAVAEIAFVTGVSTSRRASLQQIDKFRAWTAVERSALAAARKTSQVLRDVGMSAGELRDVDRLLSLLLYPHPYRRANAETIETNQHGQQSLWPHGISGDFPILIVHLADSTNAVLLRQVISAYKLWRRQGITIELVIVNEEDSSYSPTLPGFLRRLLSTMGADRWLNRRGGIFVIVRDQIDPDEFVTLQTAARVVLHAADGPLDEQLEEMDQLPAELPELITTLAPEDIQQATPDIERPTDLQFDNGWGGFRCDGKEYVIYLEPDQATPAPWINVVANEQFGFIASENGGGYTWAVNSGENRLTTWRNDPITDMPAEVLYVRDEETGEVWSPTRSPAPAGVPYLVRHGAGYTIHEHNSHGLQQRLRLFVPCDDSQDVKRTSEGDPIKILSLRMRNLHPRNRRVSVTLYTEWILGAMGEPAREFIVPEYYDGDAPILLARNPYDPDFSERTMAISAGRPLHGLTTDRTEFLGRLGSLRNPAALSRVGFSNTVHAGFDTCGTIQVHIDLPVDGEEEIHFLIAQAENRQETIELVNRYTREEAIEAAWQEVHRFWDATLGAVQVSTPDQGMNLLLNRWLLYQALACRIWGRSALYQSSGAYGFRDQLQDVMSLLHTRPDLARAHILRAARHQFEEGDVLHWWHPPAARGVRTRITDDLLWLPYVTARYIAATDDVAILEEEVPFLTGEPLLPDEHERYAQYNISEATGTIHEHCRRALRQGFALGRHDLPLMGGGDWNDGMNRVGHEGKGESIWLGWFLYTTLVDYARICQRVERTEEASEYLTMAEELQRALEEYGWDGDWYLRAYFDDGTPLGSAVNRECRIDSIAQSWSVLSKAGDSERAQRAMDAVVDHLVRWDERLILLFEPPFDDTKRDPGYIKGYLPGIRENGGQYTHAALWTIWAFVELGNGELAESLFRLINPIYRSDSADAVQCYQVEPYVISADVYGVAPHVGRGGWTWYTGSSGWMYRLGVEGILGLERQGTTLIVDPCVPPDWSKFVLTYRFGSACYEIIVHNPDGVARGVATVSLDGVDLPEKSIPLQDDDQHHTVEIFMGNGRVS